MRNYGLSEKWQPLFGQEGGSETHLQNNGVKEHDLFLFFGWFRQTEYRCGEIKYVKGAMDKHVIFGYLQIGKMYRTYEDLPLSIPMHPHATQRRYDSKRNCIYGASRRFLHDERYPGCGTFGYSEKLVLTKKGCSRSKWDLPDFFKSAEISHHSSQSFKDGYFDSAKIGQEFVISDNEMIKDWAIEIIRTGVKDAA